MSETRLCAVCGRPLPDLKGGRRVCPACVAARRRQYMAAYMQRKRSADGEGETRFCPVCGAAFTLGEEGAKRLYCSDRCAAEHIRRAEARRYAKAHPPDRPKKRRGRPPCSRQKNPAPVPPPPVRIIPTGPPLDETIAEARREGKTYGQLQAERLLARMASERAERQARNERPL